MLNSLPAELTAELLEASASISTETLLSASQISHNFQKVFKAQYDHFLSIAARNEIPPDLIGMALLVGNFHAPMMAPGESPQMEWESRVRQGIQHFEAVLAKKPRDSGTNAILVNALKTHHAVKHFADKFKFAYSTYKALNNGYRCRHTWSSTAFNKKEHLQETWFHTIYLYFIETTYPQSDPETIFFRYWGTTRAELYEEPRIFLSTFSKS